MSVLATLSLGWACVYLYVGVFCISLWGPRRDQGELLAFALLCLGMLVFAGAGAVRLETQSLQTALIASEWRAAGISLAPAMLLYLVLRLLNLQRPAVLRLSGATSLVSVGLALSGAMFTAVPRQAVLTLAGGEPPLLPVATTTRYAAGAAGLLIGLYGTWLLIRHRRRLPSRTPIAAALLLVLAAGAHDLAMRLARISAPTLLEHAFLPLVVVMAYVLLLRLSRTGKAVSRRKLALERRGRALDETRRALHAQEPLAAVGELANLFAGEVRQPVTRLTDAVERLVRADAELPGALGQMEGELGRLERSVNDLLGYARTLTPSRQSLDLRPLLPELRSRTQRSRGDGPGLQAELADGPLRVWADRELLLQAMDGMIRGASDPEQQDSGVILRAQAGSRDGAATLQVEVPVQRGGAKLGATTERLSLAVASRIATLHEGELSTQHDATGQPSLRLELPAEGPEALEP